MHKKKSTLQILTNIEIALDYVEDLWTKIKTTSRLVVVGTVYRHPSNTIKTYERYSEKLLDIFNDLNSNNRTFYAPGDYNIDLMKVPINNNVGMHVNNMISSPYKSAIDSLNDHSKALLDDKHVSNYLNTQFYVSGVIISDLSDHY